MLIMNARSDIKLTDIINLQSLNDIQDVETLHKEAVTKISEGKNSSIRSKIIARDTLSMNQVSEPPRIKLHSDSNNQTNELNPDPQMISSARLTPQANTISSNQEKLEDFFTMIPSRRGTKTSKQGISSRGFSGKMRHIPFHASNIILNEQNQIETRNFIKETDEAPQKNRFVRQTYIVTNPYKSSFVPKTTSTNMRRDRHLGLGSTTGISNTLFGGIMGQ